MINLEVKAKFFRGFSDLSRLKILELLQSGPYHVSEIVQATGMTQPNVSNHLKCLRECGLVLDERDGRYIRYCLSDEHIADLLALADGLLSDVARGVYKCKNYNLSEGEKRNDK